MKKLILLLAILLICSNGNAQFLKKLGEKAVEAAVRTVERKVDEKSGNAIPQGKYKESKEENYTSIALQPIFSFLKDKNISGIWKLKIKDHGVTDTLLS